MAPITLRHGSQVIHVNDAAVFPAVFAEMKSASVDPSHSTDGHAKLVRDAAMYLQDLTA